MRDRSTHLTPAGLLGWLAFSLAVSWVVLIAGGYHGIEMPLLRIASLAIIGIGLTVWAILAWRQPEWRPRSAIWPALAAPFAALILATLASPLPRLAIDYLCWAILLIALYLLLVRIVAMPSARSRLGGLTAVLGLATSIAYILLVARLWFEWWELLGRLAPPMLRPAYASLIVGGPTVVPVVVVLLMAATWAGLGWETRGRRLTSVFVTVVSLVAVLLAGGRGTWLALAVATVLVGAGVAIRERRRLARLPTARGGRLVLASMAVVVILASLVMVPALLERVNAAGDGGRGYYAETVLGMFKASPLVGQGPGSWPALRIGFSQASDPDIYVPHPHDTYLLTMAESGLVGLAAGTVALVSVAWLVVGAWQSRDRERRRWGVAAAFVLVYVAVASVFDSYVNLPVVLLLAALPIAVLDATAARELREGHGRRTAAHPRVRALLTASCFGLAALAVVALVRIESVAVSHQQAVWAMYRGDFVAAREAAEAAATSDPDMVPYRLTQGIAAAANGDWWTALDAFEAAARADGLPASWVNVALARTELGYPTQDVVEALDNARHFTDLSPSVLLAAALIHDRLGMEPESVAALGAALAASPSLVADPHWRDDAWYADRFDAAFLAAAAMSDEPWELYMQRGDTAAALEQAGGEPAGVAPLVILAWAGDEVALRELQQRALDQPRDLGLVTWAARASAVNDDAGQAARFRRLADFARETTALLGYESRIMGPDRAPVPAALEVRHGYGKSVYRRDTYGELVAPGLPGVVLVDVAEQVEPLVD